MIYFWSDTHFNHTGIIEHCARPYGTVEEMNENLINRWNMTVTPQGTVYFLGDFGFSHSKLPSLDSIFARLNGTKHLVRGNHDEQNPKVGKLPWATQSDLVTVRDQGRKVIACHYPIESWKGAHKGYLHAHGHCHGSLKRVIAHRFDVGVDVWGWPVSIDRLFNEAGLQTFEASDHHGRDM